MENKNAPINIVIVSLYDKFSQSVASNLATKLDMFMVDCHEMIVYDLIDPKDVLDKCGIEYFKKREKGVVKNCAEYYDTVISIKYDLLNEYHQLFENSLIVYIKLPQDKIKQVPNSISYENRDEKLKKIAKNNVVELEKRSTSIATEKIIKMIGEYYENC